MKQSYSYNFTNQDCKLFKVKVNDFDDFKDYHSKLRGLVDPNHYEFNDFHDDRTANEWYKLLLFLLAFTTKDYDIKAEIKKNISIQQKRFKNYERDVRVALAHYIILLRTGDNTFSDYVHYQLFDNMSVDEMVDLLKKELFLRVKAYKSNDKKYGIIEIRDIHYDYDALYKEFGVDPEITDSDAYKEYIKYITTAEHSKLIKGQVKMLAEMYGEE